MLLILSQSAFTEETTDDSYDAAIEVVEQLHTVLLRVMQAADTMEFSERYSILDPVITESFDTPVIAKVILSRYWKDLTPQQHEDFIRLFNQQTVATYASRFDSFNNDVFRTISVKQLKKGRILVRTEIRSGSESPVKLDYLMHKNNEQWLIISVIADGVNDLSLKRAEYSTVIKENGYEYLVKNIEKKITEMESKKEK
jgi:phospholipid transport system substrate-binding protein